MFAQDVVCEGRFTGLDGIMTYIDSLNTNSVIHTWTCKLQTETAV
jgi:hypothetical protein